MTYTITRTGGPSSTALTNSSFSSSGSGTLNYEGGTFPGSTGNCTNPMTTSSCTVVLAMTLTGSGTFTGTWNLDAATGAGFATLSRTITGTAAGATYSISPSAVSSMGDRATDAAHKFVYTITRTGGPPATAISGAILSSAGTGTLSFEGGSFPGTTGTCNSPMTSSSCTVVFSMALTGLGDFSGSWKITAATGAGNTEISGSLSGIAKPKAALQLYGNSVVFPAASPGQISQSALVIENPGGVALSGLIGTINSSVAGVFRFPGATGSFP